MVLLITTDAALGVLVAEQLEHGGQHRVIVRSSVMDDAEARACDLLVLTEADPGGTGRADILAWRAMNGAKPVIALSRVAGESVTGVDATIDRPIRIADLVGAIGSCLVVAAPGEPIMIGGLRFEPAGKRLVNPVDRSIIRLTEKEVAILDRLWRAAGAPVSRESLLDGVWAYNRGVTTHTLESHLYRLRRKLADHPGLAITAEAGGYRLARSPASSRSI